MHLRSGSSEILTRELPSVTLILRITNVIIWVMGKLNNYQHRRNSIPYPLAMSKYWIRNWELNIFPFLATPFSYFLNCLAIWKGYCLGRWYYCPERFVAPVEPWFKGESDGWWVPSSIVELDLVKWEHTCLTSLTILVLVFGCLELVLLISTNGGSMMWAWFITRYHKRCVQWPFHCPFPVSFNCGFSK